MRCVHESRITQNDCPNNNGAVLVSNSISKDCTYCEISNCKNCDSDKLDECNECFYGLKYSIKQKKCVISCETPEKEDSSNPNLCILPCLSNCKYYTTLLGLTLLGRLCDNATECIECKSRTAAAPYEYYRLSKDRTSCTTNCPDYEGINHTLDNKQPCVDCSVDHCKCFNY